MSIPKKSQLPGFLGAGVRHYRIIQSQSSIEQRPDFGELCCRANGRPLVLGL